MFKLPPKNAETIIKNWPVIINVPQDGGKVSKFEVTADYLLLPQEEIDAMIEQARESSAGPDAAVIDRVVRNLAGFQDDSGATIPFGPDLIVIAKSIPYVRQALVTTYFDAATGRKAARKN